AASIPKRIMVSSALSASQKGASIPPAHQLQPCGPGLPAGSWIVHATPRCVSSAAIERPTTPAPRMVTGPVMPGPTKHGNDARGRGLNRYGNFPRQQWHCAASHVLGAWLPQPSTLRQDLQLLPTKASSRCHGCFSCVYVVRRMLLLPRPATGQCRFRLPSGRLSSEYTSDPSREVRGPDDGSLHPIEQVGSREDRPPLAGWASARLPGAAAPCASPRLLPGEAIHRRTWRP